MASTDLETKSGQAVDPAEEPSAAWGWHGGFPKATQIAGWFTVFSLLIMLVGNHQGILSGGGQLKVEDIWLIVLAAAVAIGLLVDLRNKRR